MEILITNSTFNGQIEHKDKRATPDPQENCHLNVKTLPKTCLFFFEKNCQKLSFSFTICLHSNGNFPEGQLQTGQSNGLEILSYVMSIYKVTL